MDKDVDYYEKLPWRVVIEPEQQDDGVIVYVASHPELEGALGTGESPEAALADLQDARRSMIEALIWEGYSIPEPALVAATTG